MPKAKFDKKASQSNPTNLGVNTSRKGFYLKDNRNNGQGQNVIKTASQTNLNKGVVQRVFKKGAKFQWLDEDTGKVYTQIEVRVDNRVKLRGHGETFSIYLNKGKWNTKAVYAQGNDKTIKPFMKAGRTYMGERGARSQQKGMAPSESHIREDSEMHEGLDDEKGAGLHELMPTNMCDKVATTNNESFDRYSEWS